MIFNVLSLRKRETSGNRWQSAYPTCELTQGHGARACSISHREAESTNMQRGKNGKYTIVS